MSKELIKKETAETSDFEQITFRYDECFVYKVPERQFNLSYHALDWGLDKPLAICSITVSVSEDSCYIRFYKNENGVHATDPLAESIIKLDFESDIKDKLDFFCEPTIDSSRYFVVRIYNKQLNKTTFMGMGFRDRSTAFNFRASLDDYCSSVHRTKEASEAIHVNLKELFSTEDNNDENSGETIDIKNIPIKPMKLDLKLLHNEKKNNRDNLPTIAIKDGLLAPPPGMEVTSGTRKTRRIRKSHENTKE
ncbi:hypothetical protein WA158_008100 [Blastocystis sp. Blastoise]